MRRGTVVSLVLSALALTACGGGEVVVTAGIEMENPEGEGTITRELSDLEVRLLPYDRDVVFDSLSRAASEPEPQIPDSLLQLQERVAEANQEWQDAQLEWNTLRDTLQTITRQLQRLNRGEARYQLLYREWQAMEGRLGRVENRMESAFARFDSLQKTIASQSQEIRTRREDWADDAFADVGDILEARLRESRREEHTDTTDAGGVARFEVPAGQWWVYARFPLPYQELYWNVPITVEGGEPAEVRLTRENAEPRPIL